MVCRYLFSSWRNNEADIGDQLRKGSNFEKESVNMLLRGVAAARRMVRNHSKSTSIFCIHNNLFPLRFHIYTLLR